MELILTGISESSSVIPYIKKSQQQKWATSLGNKYSEKKIKKRERERKKC